MERTLLAPGFEISRIVTGLWQVADQERTSALDLDAAAADMAVYADAGFDSFDMADHYGSAELIAARAYRQRPNLKVFTKWCPVPDRHSMQAVRDGIAERLDRLGVECIDLLQLHWWSYTHPGYLDVMDGLMRLREEGRIAHLGVTNFDTNHLHLLLQEGYPILTNQISASLIDRRFLGEMSALCLAKGVRLLTYGTLAGGFLSEHWLEKPDPSRIADWSKLKYHRFIQAAGGWNAFQHLLTVLARIAERKGASVANIATRWVLDAPAVAAVIVGARLTEREHRRANLKLFDVELDASDRAEIDAALGDMQPIPGDCGDEYRRAPFLTASGDLSHHLESLPSPFPSRRIGTRQVAVTGSEFEPICGYSRAIRHGNRILVSGTTATHGVDRVVGRGDPRAQAIYILDKLIAAILSLGGKLEDVVRTRIYLSDAADWEAVSRVHGSYFKDVLPANTLFEIGRLVGDYRLEMEAEAIVDG